MVNKSFTTLLNRICDERQVSSAELAAFVKRPCSTLRKWLAGTSGPDRTVIVEICRRLSVDPSVVLDQATAEKLQDTFLSLQLLQERYARQRRIDAKALYEVVNAAAATAYTTFLRAGIPAILTIDPLNRVTIQPDGAVAAGLIIRLYGSDTCMMIDVQPKDGGTPISSEPLNDITLENAIKILAQ